MLLPTPLFPGCKKHEPVTVAIQTVNGKKGPNVNLNAGDIPIAPGSEVSVQDEIKGIHGVLGSTGSFKKIEDYLYEADCPLPNAELAEEHFHARFGKDAPQGAAGFTACSVLNHDGLVGRAYDWKYDDAVTFVVHTPANGDRFASVSICSSPAGITKESVEAHTVPASLWAILPFYAVDGMNENGVTCSVCVVHGKGSEDILWHGKEFCAVGAVRHVLDRARTAEEGAGIIASEAWMPASVKLGGYSLHFMVTDEMHTFIVEDGVVIDITDDDIKAMTNFRLGSRSFLDETGHADVNKIVSYDPYGTGVERYNELVDYAKSPTSEETGMREWFTGFVYSDAYRESLLTRSTTRPSDFAGIEISRDHFAKINETEAIRAWFKSAKVHEKWVARERDGKFWQTVHSAVYDVAARMVSVVVQEGTAVHDFPIVREGGGSGTVKSVNDVGPDSRTGNVALTAQDIPYGGEGASNVETAIELNTQAAVDNAEAIDSLEEQVGEIKTTTYTKSEVDDKINQSAAHYLTKRTGTEGHYSYPQFATHADLAAAKAAHTEANPQFFYGVEGHTPDKNDYCVVLADETHDGATTRYMFVGSWNDNGYFRYQYTINETALTEKQWAAINSLTSVDEDGNLCFDGIPFINSRGELLFTEADPIFTAWKNEVQIILGSGANVASGKYKQIAIGAHATANGQNSIALGSSEPGGRTNGPRAMAQNAIAIGAGAVASAVGAIQILAGTNNTSGTMQIGNKRVAFVSDIPISQADIDDYRYYKGHWDVGVTYKTGDIVRAERTVEGQEEKEVTYFKSLKDNNRANNPFTTPTYWSVTTDDEGLEKLTLFVKAAIAGMTGADIPVSPTNTDKIDVALGKIETIYLKYDGTNIKRDDTVLTSFSALLALVRTGRVILEATATPSLASSLALFRPQLNNANAILFDATGEINGVIETRNINVKRKGTDGIEIVSGGLNALAKKSEVFIRDENFNLSACKIGPVWKDYDNIAVGEGIPLNNVVSYKGEYYLFLNYIKKSSQGFSRDASYEKGNAKKLGAHGERSVALGENTSANGDHAIALGAYSIAGLSGDGEHDGEYSRADGLECVATGFASRATGVRANAKDNLSSVWSGDENDDPYESHGDGTANFNPLAQEEDETVVPTAFQKLTGFFIGAKHLYDWIKDFFTANVVAPASDMAFSSDENKDKVPTCGSVGAALGRRAVEAHWYKCDHDDDVQMLGVIGDPLDKNYIGFINGEKVEMLLEEDEDYIGIYLGSSSPNNYWYIIKATKEVKCNFDAEVDLGVGALAAVLTPSAKAALFTDTAFIEAVADKLTDADLNALCTTCGITTTGKDRAAKLLALFTENTKLPFTSQDITDFLNYKGEFEVREWVNPYGEGDVVSHANAFYVHHGTDVAGEWYGDDWTLIYTKDEGKTGLERLIDLFGESNTVLGSTIREKVLADGEGEIKDSLFKDESFGGGSSSAPEGSLSKTVADIKASARPNITVVGSPTINGGSVSGFSANNYLVFPSTVDIGNATVDFDLTVQTGAQVATQENILDSWCGLALAIENGQWVLAVSTDGTTFANVGRGGTVTANTPYRLRISFSHTLEGGHIVTLRESDGEGGYGEPIISMALAAHIFPKPLYFGGANPFSGVNHIFTGVINIGACSMTFNGTQVWNGWFGVVPPHKHKAADITDFAKAVRALFGNAEITEYGTEA